MTRRELLASALAASVARADTPLHRSQISAINDEIGLTVDETIAFATQYGVQWLEMRSAQTPGKTQYCEGLGDPELRELKKRLDGNGLKVSVLDTSVLKCAFPGTAPVSREDFYVKYFAELGLTDDDLFRKRFDLMKRGIAAAHALGTRDIRIFSFWRVKEPDKIAPQIGEILAGMAEAAQKEDGRILLENETSTNVATSDETAAMFRLVPSRAFRLNWDPQNSVSYEPEPFPDGYARLPKDRISNVHVKAEGLFGPKHPLDWGAIMHALLRDGYSARFSLETHRGHGPKNVEASRECIQKMIQLIKAA